MGALGLFYTFVVMMMILFPRNSIFLFFKNVPNWRRSLYLDLELSQSCRDFHNFWIVSQA